MYCDTGKLPMLILDFVEAFKKYLNGLILFTSVIVGALFFSFSISADEIKSEPHKTFSPFTDNLAWGKAKDPKNEKIRVLLSKFKKALLDADRQTLNELVGNNFKQIELIGSQIIAKLNGQDAFDLETKEIRFHKIYYNIVGFTTEGPKGRINAVLISSYHAKNFTRRFYEMFSFSYDKNKGVGKLISQVRTRLFTNEKMKKTGKFILLDEVYYMNLTREIDKYGVLNRDLIFQKMSLKSAKRIRGSFNKDDRYVAVFIPNFFVKPGSVITIEHHYTRPGRNPKRLGSWYSYGQDFFVKKVQPFIFFPTTAWGSYDGKVKFSAFLDGALIHEKSFGIDAAYR